MVERIERLPSLEELEVFSQHPLLAALTIPNFPDSNTEDYAIWIKDVQTRAQAIKREWLASRGTRSFTNALSLILNMTESQKLFYKRVLRQQREEMVRTLLLIGYEVGSMEQLNIVRDAVVERVIDDMELVAPSGNVTAMTLRRGAVNGVMNAGVYCKQLLPVVNNPLESEEFIRSLSDQDGVGQEIFTRPLTPSDN